MHLKTAILLVYYYLLASKGSFIFISIYGKKQAAFFIVFLCQSCKKIGFQTMTAVSGGVL
jgi:hypothetical protein